MAKQSSRQAFNRLCNQVESTKAGGSYFGAPWYLVRAGDTLLYRENKDGTISMRCRETKIRVDNMPSIPEASSLLRWLIKEANDERMGFNKPGFKTEVKPDRSYD